MKGGSLHCSWGHGLGEERGAVGKAMPCGKRAGY